MTVPEWEQEPDHLEFTVRGYCYVNRPHKKKRFRKKYAQKYALKRRLITLHCQIKRVSPMLHLCGYVSVPRNHPYWGKDYGSLDVSVHGGLTYGRKTKKSFQYGFDCAHYMDYVPGMHKMFENIGIPSPYSPDTYRNMAYVTREIIMLANQLLTKAGGEGFQHWKM